MSEEIQNEGYSDAEYNKQLERAKLNLVIVGIGSIIMLFAGLVSAYIVSMGDTFWLKSSLPNAFWISTAIIALSSVTIQLAVSFAKSGKAKALKMAVVATLILGLGFVYFQFKGYGQLVDNGVHFVSNIVVTEGKYGDYYEVKYKGDYIEVDGNDYLIKGKKMTPAQEKDYQEFMAQFLDFKEKSPFKVTQYGKDFELILRHLPLELKGDQLFTSEGEKLAYLDRARLRDLAIHVRDLRGDFFARGEVGKDFKIYYKGEELEYKNRELYKDGKILSNYLQISLMGSPDTASSYLYIITFLHLLHILVTLMYMSKLVIHSFSGKINSQTNVSLRMGAIFWHFLGFLWVFLLLFLLFIH